MALFALHSVNAAYHNNQDVLSDLSLTIHTGERVALVGKSGAGKSTLLRLLYEQQPAISALIPQELGLVQTLSVFHNIYMGRLAEHSVCYNLLNLLRPLSQEIAQVRQVLEILELEDKLFTPIGELSGGQRQRTAVGRALHQRGRVLLGDEPVSAVDEHQSHVVLGAIQNTYETCVLAMHDVNLALQYTDRVIGIKGGRLVLDQPTAGLRAADLTALYQD